MHPIAQQGIAALKVSTVNTLVGAPLEKLKVLSATTNETMFQTLRRVSVNQFMLQGWAGVPQLWLNTTVGWWTFLGAQQLYRDAYKKRFKVERLSLTELSAIGALVGGTVAVVGTPFDVWNTLKQSQQFTTKKKSRVSCEDVWSAFKKQKMSYRGFRLNLASLVITNIFSVIIIERKSEFLEGVAKLWLNRFFC